MRSQDEATLTMSRRSRALVPLVARASAAGCLKTVPHYSAPLRLSQAA
jgi:hypothetical protein